MNYIAIEVLAEDVMGSTQHNHICIVVAQAQQPIGHQVSCSLLLLHLSLIIFLITN